MKIEYTNFDLWKLEADKLGWVHIDDGLIVCDYEEICIGEFDPETNTGWLMEEEDVVEVEG